MKLFANILIGLLMVFMTSCSKNDTEVAEEPAPPPVADPQPFSFGAPGDSPKTKVEPVKLSPEDQKKADRAPEGMVFIKGGCFIMGDDNAQADEKPEHEVCVDDFYMDKYEVTQARWESVMGFNPSKLVGADLPVEQVNYYDIQKFVEKSGGKCRLPTEAEWEYAARGGTVSKYYWGNILDESYVWYEDNSQKVSHPVGLKKPNQYGLYDILGNIWEWTEDWYEPLYTIGDKQNPKGPPEGENKVVRGGGFDSSAGALRVSNRTWLHPKNRVFSKVTTYGGHVNEIFNYIGFRCAQSIPKDT